MTSSLGSIRYVSECQWGERRDTRELSCFQAYDMWSYLDNVNVTRLLALSRYQMETGHFFDKNLVLKDWKMRFEELSCFYMFTLKGLDWTSGTLWLKNLSRTFRVQNEDGLISFHVPTTKAIAVLYKCVRPFEGFTTHIENEAIQTQLPNLPSDSCPTSGRPNTLLSICWCLHPVPSYLSVRLSNYHLAGAIACWGLHHSREVHHI